MTLALSWFNGIGGGGDTARARCGEGIDGGIDASMVEVYETGAAAAVLRSAVLAGAAGEDESSESYKSSSKNTRHIPFFEAFLQARFSALGMCFCAIGLKVTPHT